MMQRKRSCRRESEVESVVLNALGSETGLIFRSQLTINGRIPDVVAYECESDSLIGIEIKLRDWRRGLYQAFLNRAFVDLSYLCLPDDSVSSGRIPVDEIMGCGVGLMSVDCTNHRISIHQKPTRGMVSEERRAAMKKLMSEGGDYGSFL